MDDKINYPENGKKCIFICIILILKNMKILCTSVSVTATNINCAVVAGANRIIVHMCSMRMQANLSHKLLKTAW